MKKKTTKKAPTYSVNYFIRKFQKIKAWRWITGKFNGEKRGTHCALGFCKDEERHALVALFNTQLGLFVVSVNDEQQTEYPGAPFLGAPTPKARVLGALKVIKKKTA